MKHRVDKSITYMLMSGHETRAGFRIIHHRHMLIDNDGQIWICIEKYGPAHDIYARLIPEWDEAFDVKH